MAIHFLRPIEDCYVNYYSPDTNFDDDMTIQWGRWFWWKSNYLAYYLSRYDLTSLGITSSEIVSARLALVVGLSDCENSTTVIYPLSSAWNETTVTWNTMPEINSGVTPVELVIEKSDNWTWKELDVTEIVKTSLDTGSHGFVFVPADELNDNKTYTLDKEHGLYYTAFTNVPDWVHWGFNTMPLTTRTKMPILRIQTI